VYASIGRRAVAALLDLIPFFACLWFFLALAASRYGGWTPDGVYTLEPLATFSAVGRSAAAWLVYYIILEWLLGGTLGKWAAGIRVTRFAGRRPNLVQAIVRNLVRIVDGVAFYLVGAVFVLLTRRRQRLGDLVARTVVAVATPGGVARAAALTLILSLPFAAFGMTWYAGILTAATNRWMSSAATTRLHGEAGSEARLEGSVDLGRGRGTVGKSSGSYASGEVVNDTLIMDSARFASGRDGRERPGGVFQPGETASLLFNLTGIAAAKDASSGRVRVKARVLDSSGLDLVQPTQQDDDVAAGSRRAVPRRAEVTLPASCPPGRYRFQIRVEDLVAGRHVEANIPFTVGR
jgi:uncharacterized RDD family membrane protein YckC